MTSPKRCYGTPPPGVNLEKLTGLLIVIEGPDAAGRSSQVTLLSEWLEQKGFAVERVGLKRSELVADELARAKEGNVLSPRTMSLFYATDFYDQLENRIVPALRAGYVVLADRYIFTLMARDIVRGADREWVQSLYRKAIVPDAVYFLTASTQVLVSRSLIKHGSLDYWESGMDLGLSRDWFDSFVRYQRRMRQELKLFQEQHQYEALNTNRSVGAVQKDLRTKIAGILERFKQI